MHVRAYPKPVVNYRPLRWRPGIRCIWAGAVYTLSTYLIAFGVGAIRVLLVAPRVGPIIAVSLEAPVVLLASWWLSRWSIRKFDVNNELTLRLLMGAFSFTMLVLLEAGVSVFVFGRPLAEQATGFESVAGFIGLATQVCFACIPVVQLYQRPCCAKDH